MNPLEEAAARATRARQLALAARVAGITGHSVETVIVVLDGLRSLDYKIVADDRIKQALHTFILEERFASKPDYVDYIKHKIVAATADFLAKNGAVDFEVLERHDGQRELRGALTTILPKEPKQGDV